MQIHSIIAQLESLAPPAYQESYDNAGLLTGSGDWECSGVLATLDTTEAVVQEAVARGCNLIVAHHPLIFKGIKTISDRSYVGRALICAIKNDIAIYAVHTNLDNTLLPGVNGRIAAKLGLQNCRPLLPLTGTLQKLFCFVPTAHLDIVRQAIFDAGAGHIGAYSECSYSVLGTGTFKGGKDTHPFVGQPGIRHQEEEYRLEVILPAHLSGAVVQAMKAAHPYEEVAYELVSLLNEQPAVGSGLIGELPVEEAEAEFLDLVKEIFGTPVIRHTAFTGEKVRKVAVCGGSGSFLISKALAMGANIYITSDVKYHEFFDANDRLLIADIGHFESEQFTVDLLFDFLREKFRNFAVLKSDVKTNPVIYR